MRTFRSFEHLFTVELIRHTTREMAPLSTNYFNALIERMEKVRDEQVASIEKAAEMCAKSIR